MANFNFNKVILGGRLTANPEIKQTNSGTPVVSFSLAVNRRFKSEGGEAQTDFINVTAWRQTAEFICSYFRKGSSICIVGNIQTRSFTDKNNEKRYVTEVVADEAYFVDGKNDSTPSEAPAQASGVPNTNIVPQFEELPDGEKLPF